MPIPTIPDKNGHGQTERDRLLSQSEFIVETNNWREFGEAVAAFSKLIHPYDFIGTAEVKMDGTVRTLSIVLCCDEEQRFMCAICHRVPARPTSDNPGICTMCGQKVCAICWKRHEQDEWRPKPKTIGGKEIPF